MARIRSIKPEFWTSAQLLECSTNARLLFIGTWTFADDAGRHPWSSKQVKAEIFPADDFTEQQVLEWMGELESHGLIIRYTNDGKEFFYIDGWKHQRIDRPQTPKYPDPFDEHSTIIRRTFSPDKIGYDRKGEDKKEDLGADAPKYVFDGSVVRLNAKTFEKWKVAFPNIDLLAELTARDAWLQAAPAEDQKNWFISTSQHLANRNMKAKHGAQVIQLNDPYRGVL